MKSETYMSAKITDEGRGYNQLIIDKDKELIKDGNA